ncbi:N-acetyltransferase, putative [Rhizoctonia solani AG-3 Rhs1AP]|uniref:N-acetyltransferase, putative n=2 Tax=Rhizoctonia solani AG-3 TaxID=1086053 RepID=X8JSE0_9AGAM|nr:N-acetyltransferase, putative [Rhizoctonia solani AG-3 Rhs1AP]KEP46485.1 putative N-acetyltransferase [Rhizoctonia solani 123E]
MQAIISAPFQPLLDPSPQPFLLISPNITYKSITIGNVELLKSLNQELFPVPYPDAYYATTMRVELTDFCKLIYVDDVPVGQITCTFKPSEREGEVRLYMMLMGILPSYRSLGIGGRACRTILEAAEAHNRRVKLLRKPHYWEEDRCTSSSHEISTLPGDIVSQSFTLPITSLFMHVHVLNTAARRLYERHGFTERKRIENFYRRRGPEDTNIKDAWLFERSLFI